MKFLSILSWTPDKSQDITDTFVNWKMPKGLKILYGPCTILGANKSISIIEATDEAWVKTDRYWRHHCISETYSLMDSSEIIKIKP